MTAAGPLADLTPREREVLEAVAARRSNAEIAAHLFLSVRTVESHIASLLRKTGAASRRDLAALSAPSVAGEIVPLTPFIGRQAEQQALITALRAHRLVTALGPGGVGKTRLALAVTARQRGDWVGGVHVVDLVPVTDPDRVPVTVAAVLGVPEQRGRPLVEAIAARLADSEALLVLDNCEHVVDAVAAFLERLLSAAPRVHVLATSRVRLALPFEWTIPIPGLTVDEEGGAEASGDAVQLFVDRAVAAGADPATLDRARVAAVCRALDGLALAIELAAARVRAIGLDGLEAGLGSRLDLLAGDRRADGRHRSLRATLDWSVTLLEPPARALLRRLALPTTPIRSADAATLVGEWEPVATGRVPGLIADLVDSSLIEAIEGAGGTRLRMLETVRQYGVEQLEATGETAEGERRHLAWCAALLAAAEADPEMLADLDGLAVEVRAAIARTWPGTADRAAAFTTARRFGDLLFAHGRPSEAQRAYERAATLAHDAEDRIDVLDRGAGAAESRHFGDDALRLHRAAADAAVAAGRRGTATWHLARSAEILVRNPGIVAHRPPPETVRTLTEEAAAIGADGDPVAAVRLRIAELYVRDGQSQDRAALAEIIAAARASGDALGESAALDGLCAVQLENGELAAARASAAQRLAVLANEAPRAAVGIEYTDALLMALECALSVGDLPEADRLATRWMSAPQHAEEPHIALSRGVLVRAVLGDARRCAALGRRFADGWERAGRPRASNLAVCASAGATACDLIGDDELASRLRSMVAMLVWDPASDYVRYAQFDALALLHGGRVDAAVARLSPAPDGRSSWYDGLWRPWYAAFWAEAAVLTGVDPKEWLGRARPLVAENPVASALLDRAVALHAGGDLAAVAERLERLGAPYQAARTRIMAGGPLAERGAAALEDAGILPMTWPVGGTGGPTHTRAR